MTYRSFILFVAALASTALALLAGCTTDPVYPEQQVGVAATDLPRLDPGYYYELWFGYPRESTAGKQQHVDDANIVFVSAGGFRTNDTGALVGLDGAPARFTLPSGYNPRLLTEAVVSLQSSTAPETQPTRLVMAGSFDMSTSTYTASLTPGDSGAFGAQFNGDSSGWFLLQAPTSADPADSASGIWFVNLRSVAGSPTVFDTLPGLNLATMPTDSTNPDWTYQAWLVRNDGTPTAEYVKLGRFRATDVPDSDGAGPYAGPDPQRAYAVPGQDFTGNARRNLADGTYGVVVSVEPTAFEMNAPFLQVMSLDRIAAGTQPRSLVLIQRSHLTPGLEVTIAQ